MSYQCFSETGTNVYSDADFATNTERLNGFQPDTPASSKMVNTVLKETSAFVTAWSYVFSANMNVDDSLDVIKGKTVSGFVNGLEKYLDILNAEDVTNGDKITFSINSNEKKSFNIVNAKHSATSDNATKATIAEKANTVKTESINCTMSNLYEVYYHLYDERSYTIMPRVFLVIKLQYPAGVNAIKNEEFIVEAQVLQDSIGSGYGLLVTLPQRSSYQSEYTTVTSCTMAETISEAATLSSSVKNITVERCFIDYIPAY